MYFDQGFLLESLSTEIFYFLNLYKALEKQIISQIVVWHQRFLLDYLQQASPSYPKHLSLMNGPSSQSAMGGPKLMHMCSELPKAGSSKA